MQLSSPVPAVRVHALGVASRLRRLVFETHAPIQFVDITDEVADLVRVSGLREGVANVFSRHTTAAVCIQEAEPLLLEDLCEFLERSAPAESHYRHNDFHIIPRGVIRQITYLHDSGSLVALKAEAS